ncbi:MAG: GNAT family N-acetyltransferase [Desulfobacterales bacterium]|nr:GNAT family N-acetyltransferase [Desulfobacterales bacterium]
MIEIIETNYTKDGHEKIIIELMDHYATDIIAPLSDDVKANLVGELEKRGGIHTVIAFADNVPAGLAISIEGFSTFSCRPLLNIHDLFVSPSFRGKGISKMILKKLEEIASRIGCCKLTLEVLENNEVGINLYKSFGFAAYELDPSQGRALFLEKKL